METPGKPEGFQTCTDSHLVFFPFKRFANVEADIYMIKILDKVANMFVVSLTLYVCV